MEEDRLRYNRGLDQARMHRDAQRAQAMQKHLAETEQRLAALRAAREEALARSRELGGDSGTEAASGLDTAMADLEKALAEAADAPRLFDPGSFDVDLSGIGDTVLSSSGLSSQGTFNAAAAFGLAAGGVEERAMKAAETTAQNTRQLVDHARRGRLVFG